MLVTTGEAFAGTVAFNMAGGRFARQIKSVKELRMRNIVKQTWDYSCGPAAVATILSYYFQQPVTEKEILLYLLLTTDIHKVKKNKGFSLLDLKNFAKAKGIEATGYKMDLDSLVKLKEPALIPINIRGYDHFVVFRGFRSGRVHLGDPVFGNVAMRPEKFLRIWKGGIGLVLNKKGQAASGSLLCIEDKEMFISESAYVQRVISQSALTNVIGRGEFK